MSGRGSDGAQVIKVGAAVPEKTLTTLIQLLQTAAEAAPPSTEPASPGPRRGTAGSSHKPWTAEEDQKLIELAGTETSIKELMKEFDRSRSAIRMRLQRHGIGADLPHTRPVAASST